MSLKLPPFWNERVKSVLDTSQKKVREPSRWRSKLSNYFNIPAFSIANTWKGSSEIVAKFVYSLSVPFSFIGDTLIPTGNFCPCVSWKTGNETIVRYKLWENVGEILYVPLYSGQTVGKDFNIEIWSTNNNPIVGNGGKINLSYFTLPTTLCEEGEVNIGLGAISCSDITFDLNGWNPSIGEYYNVVNIGGCKEGELVNLVEPILIDWFVNHTFVGQQILSNPSLATCSGTRNITLTSPSTTIPPATFDSAGSGLEFQLIVHNNTNSTRYIFPCSGSCNTAFTSTFFKTATIGPFVSNKTISVSFVGEIGSAIFTEVADDGAGCLGSLKSENAGVNADIFDSFSGVVDSFFVNSMPVESPKAYVHNFGPYILIAGRYFLVEGAINALGIGSSTRIKIQIFIN